MYGRAPRLSLLALHYFLRPPLSFSQLAACATGSVLAPNLTLAVLFSIVWWRSTPLPSLSLLSSAWRRDWDALRAPSWSGILPSTGDVLLTSAAVLFSRAAPQSAAKLLYYPWAA